VRSCDGPRVSRSPRLPSPTARALSRLAGVPALEGDVHRGPEGCRPRARRHARCLASPACRRSKAACSAAQRDARREPDGTRAVSPRRRAGARRRRAARPRRMPATSSTARALSRLAGVPALEGGVQRGPEGCRPRARRHARCLASPACRRSKATCSAAQRDAATSSRWRRIVSSMQRALSTRRCRTQCRVAAPAHIRSAGRNARSGERHETARAGAPCGRRWPLPREQVSGKHRGRGRARPGVRRRVM